MKKINKEFAVFIMIYGRPESNLTYNTLKRQGYTGDIFLVGDNTDKTIKDYKKKFDCEIIIFDKKKVSKKMDTGDNTGDLRSTLFSANTIFDIAKKKGYQYFFIFCDDYKDFSFKFNEKFIYKQRVVKNLDKVFNILLKYYKKTNIKSIAFAQGGDFIGGNDAQIIKDGIKMKRKAMNTFLCSTKRPFKFIGRLNEDVTTYVNLGGKGDLFFTIPNISVSQMPTLTTKGGLSDVYLEYGTYVKSFFSIMYNPSCVVIRILGQKNKRIHHKVLWNNAVPKILNPKYKKT